MLARATSVAASSIATVMILVFIRYSFLTGVCLRCNHGRLSLVKMPRVESFDYSGYEHSHNYRLLAPISQLLSSSIECVVG